VNGFPHGETVTVIRPGASTEDPYGNEVPGTPTETDVPGCAIAPRSSSEDLQARDQVIVGLNVWMPSGTVVNATDQMRVRGVLYEIDGEPGAFSTPFTGTVGPVQVSLTRVSG
jgi:hypothetical protein